MAIVTERGVAADTSSVSHGSCFLGESIPFTSVDFIRPRLRLHSIRILHKLGYRPIPPLFCSQRGIETIFAFSREMRLRARLTVSMGVTFTTVWTLGEIFMSWMFGWQLQLALGVQQFQIVVTLSFYCSYARSFFPRLILLITLTGHKPVSGKAGQNPQD